MAQAPEQIRKEIEQTRGEMSETVAEISRRTDVPARMMSAVQKARERWFGSEAAGEAGRPQEGRFQAWVRANPSRSFLTGFAAGVFFGMLVAIRNMTRGR